METWSNTDNKYQMQPKLLFQCAFAFLIVIATCSPIIAQDNDAFKRTKIRISKETTFVTKHLRADGSPDFAAYRNEMYSKGVTPENNLMVGIIDVCGELENEEEYNQRFCDLLGIERPDPNKKVFNSYAEGHIDIDNEYEKLMDANDDLDAVSLRPWKIANHKYPRIWIEENWDIIDRFLEHLERATRFHSPLVNNSHPQVELIVFHKRLRKICGIAFYLRVRAMHKLFVDDIDGAELDLLACRKLAKLMFESKRMYYAGAARYPLESAVYGELQMCMSNKYTGHRLTDYREKIKQYEPKIDIHHILNYDKRLSCITGCVIWAIEYNSPIKNQPKDQANQCDEIDWNLFLIRLNQQIDNILEPFEGDPSVIENPIVSKFAPTLTGLDFSSKTRRGVDFAYENSGLIAKTEISAVVVIKDFLREFKILTWEDVEKSYSLADVSQFALACYQYKFDTGQFPDSMEELIAKNQELARKDHYSGKTFIYHKTGQHFMISLISKDEIQNYPDPDKTRYEPYYYTFKDRVGFHSDPKIWCDPTINY